MKNFIVSISLTICCFFGVKTAQAQVSQFSQPTYLTIQTNSPVLSQAPVTIYVPPISLSITATNPFTVITNNICVGLNVNGTQLVPQSTFIYTAATMGTNFTTNFPGYYISVPNYIFGQAIPQSGGSNTASIK